MREGVEGPGSDRWLDRRTPGVRRLVVVGSAACVVAVWYVVLAVAVPALSGGEPDWRQPIGPILGGLSGIGLVFWMQRRWSGGVGRIPDHGRALRTGRLPEDADPDVWEPLLVRDQRGHARARRVALACTGLIVVSWLLVAVMYDFGSLGWALVIVVGAGMPAWIAWATGRQRRRIEALRAQVADRSH